MSYLEKNIAVKYSEMDCNLILKPCCLLEFLQDLASEHADTNDFGYNFVRSQNLAWYLLKYRMEFNNYPENIFNLKIKTEPRGYNKLFAFRDFIISSDDKILGRVASSWGLVDLTNKTMANPSEVLKDIPDMTPFEKKENDLNYSKIRLPEKFDKEKIFEIRFDDLDVNGHVNNSNYIVWAFETLDFEFRKEYKLKTLDLLFKKEVMYGNDISSELFLEGNISTHLIKNANTNEELCLIKAEWEKRI